MSTQNFRLLSNPFFSQTQKSHTKAVRLSTDSVDKLRTQTQPALVSIYNDYLPFHNAYMQLNVAVSIADGTYKGKTLGFNDVLDTLPEKLKAYELSMKEEARPEDAWDTMGNFLLLVGILGLEWFTRRRVGLL